VFTNILVSVLFRVMYLSDTTTRQFFTAHRTDCSVYGLSQARDLATRALLD